MTNYAVDISLVFDQLPPSSIIDWLSDSLYRWRGVAIWPETEATVHKCDFSADFEMPRYGNYHVSFSYRAGEEVIAKTIGFAGIENAPPYSVGDIFLLKYSPKRPSRYYCATHRSRAEGVALILFFVAVGIIGALLAIAFDPDSTH